MKIELVKGSGNLSGRGGEGVVSPCAQEEDSLRKVWWINTVALAIFSVGIIGSERVAPFVPRAIASETPAFQFIPPANFPDNAPEPQPKAESAESGGELSAEIPHVPEPIKFDGLGTTGVETLDPTPVVGREDADGSQRVQLWGGGGGLGRERGNAKPEEFTGRGKRGAQGYVPQPDVMDMPRALRDELPRGTVSMKLGFRVAANGKIVEIHVDQSSGNRLLDQFILEWYKRKGVFIGGAAERAFVETLSLQLPE